MLFYLLYLIKLNGEGLYHLNCAAGTIDRFVNLYLDRDVVADILNMTDDAYMSAIFASKWTKCVDGIGERLSAEWAESLINEECIDRKALTDVAQCQGKG